MKAGQTPIVLIDRSNDKIFISFKVSTIDEKNFIQIADELDEIARAPKPQSVLIDLTGVRRVDELGLIILQAFRESVKDVGGTAIFRGPTDQIERAVTETRLARQFDSRNSIRQSPQWARW